MFQSWSHDCVLVEVSEKVDFKHQSYTDWIWILGLFLRLILYWSWLSCFNLWSFRCHRHKGNNNIYENQRYHIMYDMSISIIIIYLKLLYMAKNQFTHTVQCISYFFKKNHSHPPDDNIGNFYFLKIYCSSTDVYEVLIKM